MRATDFSNILFQAMQLCGLDREDFNTYTFGQLRDLASARLRMAWEYDRWQELVKIEKVNTVTTNGVVYFMVPDTYGEILGVYTADPAATTRVQDVGYDLQPFNDGMRCVLAKKNAEVWVEYRTVPPSLYGNPYDSAVIYYPGSQVYFDSASGTGNFTPAIGKPYYGNFYTCKVQAAAGQDPGNPSHAAKWEKVKIPYIFANYLARAVNSDYLRSEGMQELALQAEQEATGQLLLEIDKMGRQQGLTRKINFINPY